MNMAKCQGWRPRRPTCYDGTTTATTEPGQLRKAKNASRCGPMDSSAVIHGGEVADESQDEQRRSREEIAQVGIICKQR